MQCIHRKEWVLGVVWLGLMSVTVWADDVVVKPDSIQVGTMSIQDTTSEYVIEATGENKDFYIRVMDGTSSEDAFRIDSSENARIYTCDDLIVGDNLSVYDNMTVHDNATVYDNLTMGGDLDVGGTVDVDGYAYFDYDLEVVDTLYCDWGEEVEIECELDVWEDAFIGGKLYSTGGYDPPYVLYDQQSRTEIVERIQDEVPPDKINGAALFFNKETKRLEVYVASEGTFYDLQGNELAKLSEVAQPRGSYKTEYWLEKMTGIVQNRQKRVKDQYVLKEGIDFDRQTGAFRNRITDEQVMRDQALEWRSITKGAYYSTDGALLRRESQPEDQADEAYVVRYRFDPLSGETRAVRRKVQGRYEILEGYEFNSKTGQFMELETEQVVTRDQAVRWISAEEWVERANDTESSD